MKYLKSNSRYRNSGDRNSGSYNSGDRNSGSYNSGNYNSGYRNSGYRNSGDCNSGDYNSGNYNSGDYNSGNYNSGSYNSGNYNSGNYNSGNYNSGDCNTNEPTVRLFNKDSGWEFNSEKHLKFRSIIKSKLNPLLEWVNYRVMTDLEKQENPEAETTGGYLKRYTEMFNGNDLTDEEIKFLRSVPNFDADILLECTGIDITNQKKKIVIDGKEILISKESYEEFKKQFK